MARRADRPAQTTTAWTIASGPGNRAASQLPARSPRFPGRPACTGPAAHPACSSESPPRQALTHLSFCGGRAGRGHPGLRVLLCQGCPSSQRSDADTDRSAARRPGGPSHSWAGRAQLWEPMGETDECSAEVGSWSAGGRVSPRHASAAAWLSWGQVGRHCSVRWTGTTALCTVHAPGLTPHGPGRALGRRAQQAELRPEV